VPHPSEPRLLVLHTLRLKGFTEASPVARSTGLDPPVVEEHLRVLADDGLALRREGRVSGWSLTPAGRAAHGAAVAAELAAAGARLTVEAAYRRFLGLNGDMLGVCTDWQMRTVDGGQVLNDHADPDYDRDVVARLTAIHDQVLPVTAELSTSLLRFGRYGGRLSAALDRVAAGEREWFTKPVIDSYHTVWFELHEDLLCTLGLERASESQSG
jgi:DNA-binding transcriptional ArsR family regulator